MCKTPLMNEPISQFGGKNLNFWYNSFCPSICQIYFLLFLQIFLKKQDLYEGVENHAAKDAHGLPNIAIVLWHNKVYKNHVLHLTAPIHSKPCWVFAVWFTPCGAITVAHCIVYRHPYLWNPIKGLLLIDNPIVHFVSKYIYTCTCGGVQLWFSQISWYTAYISFFFKTMTWFQALLLIYKANK